MAKFGEQTTGAEVVDAFPSQVQDKTFLIVGPSERSLGATCAIELAAARPAHILLAGRTRAKIEPVITAISATSPEIRVTFVETDLCSNASVAAAAETINSLVFSIHALLNAAGVMAVRTFEKSADGVERQFAANHLGHFLLTNLVMDKLIAARQSTVVNVTSLGYELAECDFDDPNFQDGKTYDPWRAYGQAKTANVQYAVGLARKLGDKGVAAFVVHPGCWSWKPNCKQTPAWIKTSSQKAGSLQSNVMAAWSPPPMTPKSLSQGSATILVAALDNSLRSHSPAFLRDCEVATARDYAVSPANAEKLWRLSEHLVGKEFRF